MSAQMIRTLVLSPYELTPGKQVTRVYRSVPTTMWKGGTIDELANYYKDFIPDGWRLYAKTDKTLKELENAQAAGPGDKDE